MKEFTGTTYTEWLDYHQKYGYDQLVKHLQANFPTLPVYFKIGKDGKD